MRVSAALAGTLLAAATLGQVQLSVTRNGRPIGSGSITQKLLPDGGKSVELRMTLDQGTRSLTVRQLSIYNTNGEPVRMLIETSEKGVPGVTSRVATFSGGTATVVTQGGGARQTRSVPVPAGASLADPSQFWFIRTQPTPGAAARFRRFNLNSLTWDEAETRYEGRTPLKIGARTVQARKVTGATPAKFTAWMDDTGLPYRLEEENGFVFQREGP